MANLFAETFPEAMNSPWHARWTTATSGAGTVCDVHSTIAAGRMSTGTTTYGKVGARNTTALTSTDYTLTAQLKIPATYSEWYAFIHVRGDGSFSNTYKLPNSYQFRYMGGTWGYIVPEVYQVNAGGGETLIRSDTPGYHYDPVYPGFMSVKIQVSGSSPVTLKHKQWETAGTEPSDASYGDLSPFVTVNNTGAFFELSVQGGSNTTSDDFYWDNISVDTASVTNTKAITATNPSTATLATVKTSAGVPSMTRSRYTPGTVQTRNWRGW